MERIERTCAAHGILLGAAPVFDYLRTYEEPMSGVQLSLFD